LFLLSAPKVQPPKTIFKNLREVIQQKVQQKLQEIGGEEKINPKKAYLGTITKLEKNNLSLDSNGQKYEFVISEDATFVNQKQMKIKITDLKEGQNVLVLTLAKDKIVYAKKYSSSIPLN